MSQQNASGEQRVLTTHQAAKLVQVDPSSIVKWANDGLLKTYRTPGGHRRIEVRDLITFLRGRGMPIPQALQPSRPRVVWTGGDETVLERVQRHFRSVLDEVDLHLSSSLHAALLEIGQAPPAAVVIHGDGSGAIDAVRALRSFGSTRETKLVFVAASHGSPDESHARAAGADDVWSEHAVEPDRLLELVRS